MLYDCLKIFHILSATLFLTSVMYSAHLWFHQRGPRETSELAARIQTQTLSLILPAAFIQLATGFSMLSLRENDFNQPWIIGSIIGFITVMGTWFSFMYFLTQSQQIFIRESRKSFNRDQYLYFRRIQSILIGICFSALLCMIFFMANKP